MYTGFSTLHGGGTLSSGAGGTVNATVDHRQVMVYGLRQSILAPTGLAALTHVGVEIDIQAAGHGYTTSLFDNMNAFVASEEVDPFASATAGIVLQHTRPRWAPYVFLGMGFTAIPNDFPTTLTYGFGVKFYYRSLMLRVEARSHEFDVEGVLVDNPMLPQSFSEGIRLSQVLVGISFLPN